MARSARRGLTLIELLVGIAIIAILLALGIPSMREWMINQRVSATASEILTDIQFARSEAVSRNMIGSMRFMGGGNCYTVQVSTGTSTTNSCNCTLDSNRCPASHIELKTFKPEAGVTITTNFAGNVPIMFAQVTQLAQTLNSSPIAITVDGGGSGRNRVIVCAGAGMHRPSMCKPAGSTVSGIPTCGAPACN